MYVEAIASNSSTNEHSMSNNNVSPVSTQSAQSTQPAQSAQSTDAVDADTVESQNDVVATIEANNVHKVHKLAKKRKLAEDYLDASRCSSRDFNFIVMCDNQLEMPFCCE